MLCWTGNVFCGSGNFDEGLACGSAGNTIMRISQVIICAFGIFMGVLAIVLLEINVSLG